MRIALRSRASFLAAASVLALAVISSGAAGADAYAPKKGDEVVVYRHYFKAGTFADGVKLVEAEFPKAQAASGQTRHNEYLLDPANYEIDVVSYFAPGSSVEAWHESASRVDVLKKLEPLFNKPIEIHEYVFDGDADAPSK